MVQLEDKFLLFLRDLCPVFDSWNFERMNEELDSVEKGGQKHPPVDEIRAKLWSLTRLMVLEDVERIIQYFDVSLMSLELRLLTWASWYFIHYEMYFHTMLDGYGFVPRVEHYACMLDVLGQAVIFKNPKNSLDQLSRTWKEHMKEEYTVAGLWYFMVAAGATVTEDDQVYGWASWKSRNCS